MLQILDDGRLLLKGEVRGGQTLLVDARDGALTFTPSAVLVG